MGKKRHIQSALLRWIINLVSVHGSCGFAKDQVKIWNLNAHSRRKKLTTTSKSYRRSKKPAQRLNAEMSDRASSNPRLHYAGGGGGTFLIINGIWCKNENSHYECLFETLLRSLIGFNTYGFAYYVVITVPIYSASCMLFRLYIISLLLRVIHSKSSTRKCSNMPLKN